MIRVPRQPWPTQPTQASGFSLVELLVAALIMAISSMGGTLLFGQATRQANAIRQTLQRQFEIGNDLAVIRDHNDRYSCASGTCSVALSGDPPNQEQYVPADYAAFNDLCAKGLANGLITHINATAIPARLNTVFQVTRTAALDPTSVDDDDPTLSAPPHRYLVTWRSADNRVIRQVQLIPTVAAWCP